MKSANWTNLLTAGLFFAGLGALATVGWGEANADEDGTAANSAGQSDSPIRLGPKVLHPAAMNVGSRIPDFSYSDINGKSGRLCDFTNASAIVIAMTGTGCPLCKKFAPTLATLERRYSDQGVKFLFINPNRSDDLQQLQEEVRTQGFAGPYVRDDEMEICRLLETKTTTEVYVLDRARTLVYRGAVDDQYGLGYAIEAPRKTFLIDVLDSLAQNREPNVTATTAPGCDLFYPEVGSPAANEGKISSEVSYHNRVSRIIARNCLECHREDSVAPMPLSTFAEVRDYAGMIKSVVERGVMPPWFAAEGEVAQADSATGKVAESHSIWANERSLSTSEKKDLLAWIESGAPEGNPDDAPLPRHFADGWLIGQPDAVFQFPEPVKIKATGVLRYKNITVETDLKEDKWVRSIEIVPGDRSVVHHVLVFAFPPGVEPGDERRGGVDYWGIYVPGNSTQIYPDGYARRLPKNARLKFQVHYTTNGRATEDQTKIGLIFADEAPKYEVKTASIVETDFKIPPGASDHRVVKPFPIRTDVEVLGYLPHHHLRGKACRYELTTPAGDKEVLLDIPRYDFNWQLFYQYVEPKLITKGSRIDYTAWYDNSKDNPANPDPTKTIGWGEQTDDEMHLGYIEYIVPATQNESDQYDLGNAPRSGNVFDRLDTDGDGELTKSEIRDRLPNGEAALRIFDLLDKNRDGKLNRSEAATLRRDGN